MLYTPRNGDVAVLTIPYGSHLYGTSGPGSDFDFKCITLPLERDLMLGKPLRVTKYKYDADGNPVPEDKPMPDGGYEAEHIPVHKLFSDYLGGQAYAVEFVYATMAGYHEGHLAPPGTMASRAACSLAEVLRVLGTTYVHQNVNGMVGFAVKQTFDYVRRGERLNAARAVLDVTNDVLAKYAASFTGLKPSQIPPLRLDSLWSNPPEVRVLDEIATRTGLEVGETTNNNKTMRTLRLNGREYLETTAVTHFASAVEKLVAQYGERSTKASEVDVDWKSLSHAVRVYEQVLDLLRTDMINFPRTNAEFLKKIKYGQLPLEEVKTLLRYLDDQVTAELAATKLPSVDDEMRHDVDELLLDWLYGVY